MNYARHIGTRNVDGRSLRGSNEPVPGTGETVFFGDDGVPESLRPLNHWAFYRLPASVVPSMFHGYVVGEDTDKRCERMLHAPNRCESCRRSGKSKDGAA